MTKLDIMSRKSETITVLKGEPCQVAINRDPTDFRIESQDQQGPFLLRVDYGQATNRMNMYFSVKNCKASSYDCHSKVMRSQPDKIEVPAGTKDGVFQVPFVYWSMELIEEAKKQREISVTLTATF